MAIPTVYAGVQFRSRLEARWAAFFDLLRWPWDYEPIDLDGYIPDFLIGPSRKLLIEVKGSSDDYTVAIEKLERSGWTGEFLLVSSSLVYECDESRDDYPVLVPGVSGNVADGEAVVYGDFGSPLCLERNKAGAYDLRMYGSSDYDPILFGGTGYSRDRLDPQDAEAVRLWREAGNRVQWRSPRRETKS